jgi:hypothetical protein
MQLPNDLAAKIVESTLPWSDATQFHIKAFLERYTLHDSNWLGLQVDCGWEDSVVAVIVFDPVWNSSISAPTSVVANWPLLFMRFTCVSSIQLSGFSDIGGLQRGISEVTVRATSEEEVITTLRDHYGANVTLQHFPLIDILIMSPDGELIRVPSVA